MSLRVVILPALAVFGAVAWWAGRGEDDATVDRAPAVVPASPPATDSGWPQIAPVDSRAAEDSAATPGDMPADASFATYVTGKYRFLFDDALPLEAANKLRVALLEREHVAVAINTARQSTDAEAKDSIPRQQAELDELDRKIGSLLRPSDLAAFEVLRDSDVEQFQLDDYAGGVSAVAPISDSDRKAILFTKLAHRQRFRQVLADSGLMRGELNASERRLAFADVSRALGASRDHYLQEVRQYLYNDEQFTLLSNYENSEFAAELEKLRRIAYGE
jgi:hypothetical protein